MPLSTSKIPWGTFEMYLGISDVRRGIVNMQPGTGDVRRGIFDVQWGIADVHSSTADVQKGTDEVQEGTFEAQIHPGSEPSSVHRERTFMVLPSGRSSFILRSSVHRTRLCSPVVTVSCGADQAMVIVAAASSNP
jgi:hypothetical protein